MNFEYKVGFHKLTGKNLDFVLIQRKSSSVTLARVSVNAQHNHYLV